MAGGIAAEGAKLEAEEKRAALAKDIIESMPPDLDVSAHIVAAKYKIGDFGAVVATVREEAAARVSDAYAAALADKLAALHALGDELVLSVPVGPALADKIAAIFMI